MIIRWARGAKPSALQDLSITGFGYWSRTFYRHPTFDEDTTYFRADGEVGIPISNLSPQTGAAVFMHPFHVWYPLR